MKQPVHRTVYIAPYHHAQSHFLGKLFYVRENVNNFFSFKDLYTCIYVKLLLWMLMSLWLKLNNPEEYIKESLFD